MNPSETQTTEELTARALAPYSERPDAESVARLVDDLITAGCELHTEVSQVPAAQRTERAGAALNEWSYFIDVGPSSHGDHANWNHARGLARILRNLAEANQDREPVRGDETTG
ncbi:hypothetical protein J7F03_12755 [Streptomyces sp. ISL-43]|uniref:DUF6415 family natural product biosynthesis protein n=1 Tax=Streptomyces sp. ISL-43 TaxID=2819183 RepID=UPI001BEAD865|nr:DUF6415 family natural product biosynthesis protein [Streptomyces sp. ISL-43]MBT2447932.1 hypothetical protein [Streptomyces sp. ISL-43]